MLEKPVIKNSFWRSVASVLGNVSLAVLGAAGGMVVLLQIYTLPFLLSPLIHMSALVLAIMFFLAGKVVIAAILSEVWRKGQSYKSYGSLSITLFGLLLFVFLQWTGGVKGTQLVFIMPFEIIIGLALLHRRRRAPLHLRC